MAASASVGSVEAATNSGTLPSVVWRIGRRKSANGGPIEVRAPVEQLRSGERSIVPDLGDADFDGSATDAATAIDLFGDVWHEVRAGDVDETDDVAEVHRHADPDRIAAEAVGARRVGVCGEDGVDVERV